MSTASLTLSLFVDRMFLSWYSEAAVAASVPGGITYFTICSFFIGTAQYVNSIVAQYYGAQDLRSCSSAVWQGVLFGLLSIPVILLCIPVGFAVFSWADHDPVVQQLENDYFALLMAGGVVQPINAALASFFSGRGKTIVVMWVQIIIAWIFFVPPVYFIIQYFGMGVLAAWYWGLFYVMLIGIVFWGRFRRGSWRTISMIKRS
jgi:MATE family multidrug resistance protein